MERPQRGVQQRFKASGTSNEMETRWVALEIFAGCCRFKFRWQLPEKKVGMHFPRLIYIWVMIFSKGIQADANQQISQAHGEAGEASEVTIRVRTEASD